MSRKSKVAVVKSHDRAGAARRAIALAGMPDRGGKRVFLKPNYNSADPTPGCTHTDTLRATVEAIRAQKPESITVGDRSGMGDTREVFGARGVFDLANQMGFEAVVLDELPDDAWQHFEAPDGHWRNGFWFAGPPLEADAVISLCCLKTHQFGGHFTMSLKNSVGLVHRRNMRELHASVLDQRRMVAEVNVAYSPALVVMDDVDAFVDGGPHRGTRWAAGLTFAARDRVALDAAGVAALKVHGTTRNIEKRAVFEQEQIQRAVELGLGAASAEGVELVSDDSAGEEVAGQLREVLETG